MSQSRPARIWIYGGIIFMLIVLLMFAIGIAIYFHEHPPAAEKWAPNDAAVIISQQEATKAQAEYGAAAIKRDTELRMQVVENCAKKGNIPVLFGGEFATLNWPLSML